MTESERNTHRLLIKQTVERAIPQTIINATRLMTDEEIEELQRQTQQRLEAQKLASEVGRKGLMVRLRRTMIRATRMYDPERDGPLKQT
jgi:tRNA C32,U32 (ribose-2'-O)-methylase TrmJ